MALANRTALITGGNRGLGLEVAKRVVSSGGSVVLACRDVKHGEYSLALLIRLSSVVGSWLCPMLVTSCRPGEVGRPQNNPRAFPSAFWLLPTLASCCSK